MKGRCYNERSSVFKYYGARGIRVCDEWLGSYEAFRDWAITNGYAQHLELDRRKVNEGYFPNNCRWATSAQQMQNTRKRRDGLTSRYKGVSRQNGARSWRAQIFSGGVARHIGNYATALQAALAYDSAAFGLRGEFAFLNFPERFNNKEVSNFSS